MTEFSALSNGGPLLEGDKLLVARPNTDGFDPLKLDPQQVLDYIKTRNHFLGDFSKWNTAKGRGASSPARLLFLGDSIVQGHGANSGSDLFTKGFARYFANNFSWLFGSIYGNQNVTTSMGTYEVYNPDVASSAWAFGASADDIIGGRFFRMGSGGTGDLTWTPPETFDTLIFVYPQLSGLGSVDVIVDGTTIDTVNENGSTACGVKTYTGLGHSTHTVVIRGTSVSGDVYVSALEMQDRTTGEPVYIQGGQAGAKATDLINNSNAYNAYNEMDVLNFDYAFVFCTVNDVNSNTTDSDYYTSIETLVDKLNETANGCLMFGFPLDAASTRSGTSVVYEEALKHIAMDHGWSFFDARDVFGHSFVNATRLSLKYDSLHPNEAGHQALAAALYAFIGPSL